MAIPSHLTETVNALSGSVTCRLVCAAPGSPQSARDCCQPPSQLDGFRATQIKGDSRVEPYGGSGGRRCRCHEAGPVQPEPAHDEPRQRVELNAGLAGLEADDGVGRDPSGGRERLQADTLTLAFFAEASSNASGDGPHRAPQRGAKAAERSLVGGLTNDDMMASAATN